MKWLIVLSLVVSATVASSVDFGEVHPRHSDARMPLIPPSGLPVEGRITNGAAATTKQFPYQAGLLLEHSDGRYWCGGSLLSSVWVFTAAHCTLGVIKIQVNLGTLRSSPIGDVGEEVFEVEATASTVIVHEGYDSSTLENDVSLIRLPSEVTFTEYIQPVSLPKYTGTAPLYTGSTGVASGWGLVSDSATSISPTLNWADLPVISNAACAVYYGRLPTSCLCIGTKGTKKSTCSGDSGGPLVLEGTNTLIGVVSFGVSYGCEWEYPAGFSRVTSFLSWIAEKSGVMP